MDAMFLTTLVQSDGNRQQVTSGTLDCRNAFTLQAPLRSSDESPSSGPPSNSTLGIGVIG
ncbi:unnamed protein product, partial [Nesidiocoris tenuis]